MKAEVAVRAPAPRGLSLRVRRFARRLGQELDREEARLSVLLAGDDEVRSCSVRFTAKDAPTDVLSFPSGGEDAVTPADYLGDLVVSLDRAAAQASEHGHDLAQEVEVLVLHGVLHLLGHDHETDRGQMRALEARLARRLFGGTRGLVERAGRPGTARRGVRR